MIALSEDDERRLMQIRVLGHLEVTVDDRPVVLGGPKQRAVLAMLGLEANRTVTADRLAEGLWGEEPPASAGKMVQNYVWRLRHALPDDGGAAILTHGRGYELRIDPELVDVRRLERLRGRGEPRRHRAAIPGTRRAKRWRCSAGSRSRTWRTSRSPTSEIPRLEGLRETAAGLAIDADLASGRHLEVIGEIEALLARNPLRERLHAQRMLALYRCGRQAEALESYQHARRTLVDEIGVEPGPELRRLHEAILRQDPALDVKPAAVELPRELDAADAPPLIGRDGELRRLRVRWQRAAGGAGALVALAGGARHGQDPHRRRARIRGPPRGRPGPLRDRHAVRPRPRSPPSRRSATSGGPRCSCSTTSTAPRPTCSPRCASSPAPSAGCRCSCWPRASDLDGLAPHER